MMVGQFDIGFGSISGNALNPLNFMEVLKSDNSSGYTLNWGPDTDVVSNELQYDGCSWSFDSLWQAADTGAYLVDGHVSSLYAVKDQVLSASNFVKNDDGSATVSIGISLTNQQDATCKVGDVAIFAGFADYDAGKVVYDQDSVSFSVSGDVLTVQLPKDIIDKYKEAYSVEGVYYNFSFDITFVSTICGVESSGLVSSYILTTDVFETVVTSEA